MRVKLSASQQTRLLAATIVTLQVTDPLGGTSSVAVNGS
jgi:hypothetical protein